MARCAVEPASDRLEFAQGEEVQVDYGEGALPRTRRGKRGVVFGVGQEKLPALFASMGTSIFATDAPAEIGASAGWNATKQHSNSLEQLRFRDIVSDAVFDRNVTHRPYE